MRSAFRALGQILSDPSQILAWTESDVPWRYLIFANAGAAGVAGWAVMWRLVQEPDFLPTGATSGSSALIVIQSAVGWAQMSSILVVVLLLCVVVASSVAHRASVFLGPPVERRVLARVFAGALCPIVPRSIFAGIVAVGEGHLTVGLPWAFFDPTPLWIVYLLAAGLRPYAGRRFRYGLVALLLISSAGGQIVLNGL